MSDYRLHIQRIRDTGRLTMGRVSVWESEMQRFKCVSLELSWIHNQPWISCIPVGKYPLVKRTSEKYGTHFHIKDVPNRNWNLIHTLNYFKQSEGCTGVGQRFKYLDNDNEIDITNSQDTLDKLLAVLPDESTIIITNHDQIQRVYS